MIHVLHLIGGGEVGGAEQHVLSLLNHPCEGVKSALVCLVAPSPLASMSLGRGIPTAVFPMKFNLDLRPVRQVVQFCRQEQIHLLHCHGARGTLIGRLAGKLLSIPVVSTIHSDLATDYLSSRKGKLACLIDSLTLPLASGLIAVSDHLKTISMQRCQQKSLQIPIVTIYNGSASLDFSHRGQLRKQFREDYHIPTDRIVIGTIGRLHPVKGQIHLIEAYQQLTKKYPNLHLLLVGEGPLGARLKETLEMAHLPFTMTGYMPQAWQSLPSMDLFVLPSLQEGMGLVLLEAAQARLPIVATRTGGIPELFTSGAEALLVEPGNAEAITLACSSLLDNPSVRDALIDQAYLRSGQFRIDKMTQETKQFYHRILR